MFNPHPISRLALVLALVSTVVTSLRAAERQPNILFLFADDQRFDTLGCAGHGIVKTPAIDRLAAAGVRFRNAFVTTSVCWVSRATVLTGAPVRAHAIPGQMPAVRPEFMAAAYPAKLREAGYHTGFFGKWHTKAGAGFKPESLYDQFEAITRNPYFKTLPDGSKRHETDLICDRGVEFIKGAPKYRPFCLNLWFNAAHAEDGDKRPGIGHHPWPQSADGLYEDVTIPPPTLGAPEIFENHPQFLKNSINRQRFFWGYDTEEKYQANLRAYLRMISGIDHAIARVLKALEDAGLADNTIVVYSADNGYYLGDRGFQGKWSHFEESLRVPMIIHDPRLPKERRGRVIAEMALNVDLPATFLDWAGVKTPPTYRGRSLAPLLAGRTPDDWRREFFCEHVDLAPTLTWEGIRGERYVYARYFDQQPPFEFLHDLESDPAQLRNFAGDPSAAKALAGMRAACDAAMNQLGGPLLPRDGRNAAARAGKSAPKKAKKK